MWRSDAPFVLEGMYQAHIQRSLHVWIEYRGPIAVLLLHFWWGNASVEVVGKSTTGFGTDGNERSRSVGGQFCLWPDYRSGDHRGIAHMYRAASRFGWSK